MTTRIALVLATMIVALFAVDAYAFGGALPVFLGKKMIEFIYWITFWR